MPLRHGGRYQINKKACFVRFLKAGGGGSCCRRPGRVRYCRCILYGICCCIPSLRSAWSYCTACAITWKVCMCSMCMCVCDTYQGNLYYTVQVLNPLLGLYNFVLGGWNYGKNLYVSWRMMEVSPVQVRSWWLTYCCLLERGEKNSLLGLKLVFSFGEGGKLVDWRNRDGEWNVYLYPLYWEIDITRDFPLFCFRATQNWACCCSSILRI